MSARTQAEILERMKAVADEDYLGFKREALVTALDFEHAKPFLRDDVTADGWEQIDPEKAAKAYYEFALGKIDNHRGISAGRSIDKLTEYAWLMGRDDVVEAMSAAPYPQYGAPKVKAFADLLGLEWPEDEGMQRMARGLPCEPGCQIGCGL